MIFYKTIITLIFVFFIHNCYTIPNIKPRFFKILGQDNKDILENNDSGGYNTKELLKLVQNYADMEYSVKNILNKKTLSKYPDGKHPLGKKSVLAKRIFPPGQLTPDFEYDKQYETYFKPLVKFNKIKKMEKQQADIGVLSDISTSASSESDESEQYIKNIDDLIYKTDRDLQEVTPKEKKESQNINRKQKDRRMSIEEQGARFLKDIQQMTHTLEDKRQKSIIKDKVSVVVQELEDVHGILFDLLEKTNLMRQFSGNMLTVPTPNKLYDSKKEDKKVKDSKVPVFLPPNPLWNSWTVNPVKKISQYIGDILRQDLSLILRSYGRDGTKKTGKKSGKHRLVQEEDNSTLTEDPTEDTTEYANDDTTENPPESTPEDPSEGTPDEPTIEPPTEPVTDKETDPPTKKPTTTTTTEKEDEKTTIDATEKPNGKTTKKRIIQYPLPKIPNTMPNYNMYEKREIIDQCPGNQVRFGNVCIWVPEKIGRTRTNKRQKKSKTFLLVIIEK